MRRAALLSGVLVPVALTAAGGGFALAAPVPAAAATSACTDTWVGGAPKVLWTEAENWSTDRVPGSADNVCMSTFAIVTATGPIWIHSLQVGEEMTVVFAGTSGQQSHVMIGTTLGNLGNVELDNSSLTAPQGAGLVASGTLTGDLVNNGAVEPAYHLNVTGNYTQGASATLSAGFVQELQVTGKATLAGQLISGETPPPQPGARGTAITFSSVSGGFTSHSLGFNLVSEAQQIDVVAQPQIAASPSTVAPGGRVAVSGGDFGLVSNVAIHLDGVSGPVLGTARASFQGFYTAGVTIPSATAAGAHKLVAVGSDGRQAEVAITVS